MAWKEMKIAFNSLVEAAKNEKNDLKKEWNSFQKLAKAVNENPPMALDNLSASIKKISNGNKNISILDHGCGGGLKSFYFIALGYKNMYGVNVNYNINYLNTILKKIFKISEKRFYTTDGRILPFKESKFVFIFSLQVLEHLSDNFIDTYYSEEERVLQERGHVYHEVPHLLVPFESHSRLWFLHWLPSFLQPLAYGVFVSIQTKKNKLFQGKELAHRFNGEFVKLRTPNYHYKKIVKHFGSYNDLTVDRLVKKADFKYYDTDNPVKLRKALALLFRVPIIGFVFAKLCKNFFMLQTLAKKEKTHNL